MRASLTPPLGATLLSLILAQPSFAQAHPLSDPFSDPNSDYAFGSYWLSGDEGDYAQQGNMISWDGDGPSVWQWMATKNRGGWAGWLNPWQDGQVNVMVRCIGLVFARRHFPELITFTLVRLSRIETSLSSIGLLLFRPSCQSPISIPSWEPL